MIPLKFHLFWAGKSISYLRYLTFKTLRHFHPDSEISLYISRGYNKDVHRWGGEKQDFEGNAAKDYTDKIRDLKVKITEVEHFMNPNYCPIFQADLYRFWALYNEGGFYLDTDQIIMRCFDSLPLDKEFIYSRYQECQCGDYLPTGVLGMEKDSKIGKVAMHIVPQVYNLNDYNSSGPWAMKAIIQNADFSKSFNAPSNYFYPVNSSKFVDTIFNGTATILEESMALHWYGGHPLSQEFNKIYTEEFAKDSNDTVSRKIRELNLL